MTDFRALHRKGDPFVLPNAWDRGSAIMFEALGAKAIATTSAGYSFTKGRVDGGNLTRDEALAHAQDLASAVSVPVTGDFENGFAHDPDGAAETIRLSAEVGIAGCAIEDIELPGDTAYPFDLAVDRIRACASAARSVKGDYVLVARADGYMHKQYDLNEAIRRIQAFEKAGADCVYVPGLPDLDAAEKVVASVSVPVNVLISGAMSSYTHADMARIGAARLSTGGSLSRVAFGAAIDAMKSLTEGQFDVLSQAAPEDIINTLLTKDSGT